MNKKFVEAEFEQALTLLKNLQPRDVDPNRPNAKNRRRSRRVPTRLAVAAAIMRGERIGTPMAAEVRDVSPHGLSVAVPEPIPEDSSFVVQLPSRKGQSPAPLICRSVHCRPGKPGESFVIGAEFIGRLPEAGAVPVTAAHSAEETDRIRKAILG